MHEGTRAYVDSGIFIAAGLGTHEHHTAAIRFLRRRGVVFVTSTFAELEVLPHPEHHRDFALVGAYRRLYAACEKPRTQLRRIVDRARALGARDNIRGMDALHVAGVEIAACEIFVTTEKPDPRRKQVHRASGIEVQFIGEL